MLVLGIESTCDETAAAVVRDGRNVVAETVASQIDLHEIYGGVVPEIASRAHIEQILPVLSGAFEQAGISPAEIDAVAVAARPGLIGSLVVGLTAAKTLAWSLEKPLVAVDHVHAHLYSVVLGEARPPAFPAIGLVVSGGHTSLYRVESWLDIAPIGRTIDDAVGEAYDKVAAILGLGYPGGPIVDRLAAEGDPKRVRFPRSMLGPDSLDFSFSGLKTAVLYHVRGEKGRQWEATALSDAEIAEVCASFQAACVETLVKKIRRAVKATGARSVIVGGGVSANRGLRLALQDLDLPVHLPPMAYTTDNAAMTAGLGTILLEAGHLADLTLDAATTSLA